MRVASRKKRTVHLVIIPFWYKAFLYIYDAFKIFYLHLIITRRPWAAGICLFWFQACTFPSRLWLSVKNMLHGSYEFGGLGSIEL
jgi:hypothetical protein